MKLFGKKTLKPVLHSADCIRKIEKPVLTKDDIPYEASLIFNAGVAKYNGKYVMVFRNDYGPTEKTYPKVKFKTKWWLNELHKKYDEET